MFNKKNLKRILITTFTLVMVVGTVAFATGTGRYRDTSNFRRGRFHHNRQFREDRNYNRPRFNQWGEERPCCSNPRRNYYKEDYRQDLRRGRNPYCRFFNLDI